MVNKPQQLPVSLETQTTSATTAPAEATSLVALESSAADRHSLLLGFWLARTGAVPPDPLTVRQVLTIASELVADGVALPAVSWLLDVYRLIEQPAQTWHSAKLDPFWPTFPADLLQRYEDDCLGRLLADGVFWQTSEALLSYSEADRPVALKFIFQSVLRRWQLPGRQIRLVLIKELQRLRLDRLNEELWLALSAAALHESSWADLLAETNARVRAADTFLAREELFELQQHTAIMVLGQRVALRQTLQAATRLELALPRFKPRLESRRLVAPTRLQDESAYPVGGFSSLSTRGSVENLVQSQLALMDDERPDLFDLKYLRDELLYYSRDENQFYRRRSTYWILFPHTLETTRYKLPTMPYQQIICALGLITAVIRRLLHWLHEETLHFELIFLKSEDPLGFQRTTISLEQEWDLLHLLYRDQLSNGTISIREQFLPEVQRTLQFASQRSQQELLLLSQEWQEETIHPDVPQWQLLFQATPRLVRFSDELPSLPNLATDSTTPAWSDWEGCANRLLQAWLH